jgi:hypothetical protein
MRKKRASIIAWALAGIVVVVSIIRIVLWAAALNVAPSLFDLVEAFGWELAIPSVFSVLAAMIIARQPGNRVGWLMMIVGLAVINPIDLMVPASAPAPPISLGLWLILWIQAWSWIPVIFPIFLVPLHFPTGTPLPGRWQWVTRVAVGMWLVFMVLAVLVSEVGPSDGSWTMANPIGFISTDAANGPLLVAWAAALVATVSASVASLFVRFRRSEGVERQQIRWLLMAGALLVVAYASIFITAFIAAPENFDLSALQDLVLVLSILSVPMAIGVAIFRYRLWDLEVVINRALVYGPLTTVLAGIFAMLIAISSQLAKQILGTQSQALAAAVSAVVVAVIFQPLRTRVQAFVDKRFYPQKADLATGLVEIMPEFWAFLDRNTLIPAAQDHVRAVLGVPFTAIYLAEEDGAFELAAQGESPPETPAHIEPTAKQEAELRLKRVVSSETAGPAVGYVPIHVDRGRAVELIGLLAIGKRTNGRGYSGDELKALADLGGGIGLALRAMQMAEAKGRHRHKREILQEQTMDTVPAQLVTDLGKGAQSL